jgi:hypothetical protein
MEDHREVHEKAITDMAKTILGSLIFSGSQVKRAEDDAPFHLDTAALIYAMAVHNCVLAGEDVEALIDHANRTGSMVEDAMNKGLETRDKNAKQAH